MSHSFGIALSLIILSANPAPAFAHDDILPDGSVIGIPPTYHQVTGVSPGDVLNVRSGPAAASEIIGSFAPGAKPVEVIATYGNWAFVIADEQSGWISRSYISDIELPRIAGTPVPVGTRCHGTEPFWGLIFTGDGGLDFSAPDEAGIKLPIVASDAFVARPNRFFAVAEDTKSRMTVIVQAGQLCSDGMSDREHGWAVEILWEENDAVRAAYAGCCHRDIDGN